VLFVGAACVAIMLLAIALTSIESVNQMFVERAKAIQPYDVGQGGRFWGVARAAADERVGPRRSTDAR